MTGPDEDDAEVEGEEEWMKLLEGYGKQQPDNALETVEIGDDDEEEDQELQPDLDEMEVADEGNASDLLAAVKERLEDGGQASQYHQFLKIISQTTVDHDAALAIIEGHSDLIGAFRRCFAAPSKSKKTAGRTIFCGSSARRWLTLCPAGQPCLRKFSKGRS